ncbi:MAG: hypothetical protein IJ232_09765 [Lachnospiraceae bacterium]|nr:hypothetical protein [Lachnospiraceae bacterium]
MKKKIIAGVIFLAVISIAISAVIIYRSGDKVRAPKENDISRFEWLKMLCEETGIIECSNDEPYFEDVVSTSEYFNYVQSAVEWDVIDDKTHFNGDDLVSGKFIALTALKTLDQSSLQRELGTEDEINEKELLRYAIDQNLISEDKVHLGFTKQECEHVLSVLNDLHYNKLWQQDYEDVTYKDNVTVLSSEDIEEIIENEKVIVIKQDKAESLKADDVIVYDSRENKVKKAGRIDSMSKDGRCTIRDVELSDVIERITVLDVGEITFEDIARYYGAEVEKSVTGNITPTNMAFFDLEHENKGFKIELKVEEEDTQRYLALAFTDNETENGFSIPITDVTDLEGDYSAEINVDRIFVGGKVDYKVTAPLSKGLKYMELALDVHSTVTGEISTFSEEKKIKLCNAKIPLADGLVCVDTELYLKLSLDGSISFEADVPMEFGCVYERGKGIRKHGKGIQVNSTAKVNCKAQAMFGLEPVLKILDRDELSIVDIEIEEGVEAEAEYAYRDNGQICNDISVAAPILTAKICGDDDNISIIRELIGASIEWEIYTSESPDIWHGKLHYEVLPDGTQQFVDECTYNKQSETGDASVNDSKSDSENASKNDSKEDKKEDVSSNSVTSGLDRFYGYDLPLMFCVNYDGTLENMDYSNYVIDNGDYYTVTGKLCCLECISTQDLQDIEDKVGAQYTSASGRVYTVQSYESYNNDQRQKCVFTCSDGETYEINNLPAFSVDEYGRTFNSFVNENGNSVRADLNDVVINIPKKYAVAGVLSGAASGEIFEYSEIVYDIRFAEDGTVDMLELPQTLWIQAWTDENTKIGTLD